MTDDSPELRASDADRERVAEVLRDALAEGRLDMAEFEQRLDATYSARTYGELAPITRDLPVGGGSVAPEVSMTKEPAAAGDWAGRITGGEPSSTWAVAVMSGFQRKGRWTVPKRFTSFAFWGGGEIDLREADFADGEVVINCIAIMGGMQVIVPPGVEVVVRGLGIMGGFDHREEGVPGDPGAPRVVVTGFAFWGGVGVERKLTRAEKLRIKEERRQEKLERRQERDRDRERDRGVERGSGRKQLDASRRGHDDALHDLLGDDRSRERELQRERDRRDRRRDDPH
ncbi:DUF1707 domain-containing protein [Streptomyces sp. NPDC057245]|uniref:DUF1707 SHOCT-like domain-containing protein n=1 Tax=Streptomyces TaxID=1883 RepID=UPI001C1E3A24|nr:DUF1707 domain-containing protein [Streptomyces sp. A108]MBU6530769.1 DUF1707 and DUF2154 domain-containing protein [Streptomyces sp. A108]